MIETLKYWCQKVLPLVYDDSLSYYELLNKVALKINEMIEQVNELPDLVTETVREQLEDGTVEDIISEILTKDFFLNVKRPPEGVTAAIGDGATNDTTAFSEAINYAIEHDLAILIPEGDYVVDPIALTRANNADPAKLAIMGCGAEISRLISTSNQRILSLSSLTLTVDIRGIGIYGGGASTNYNMAALDIYSNNVTLNDIAIYDAPTALHLQGCQTFNVSNFTARNYKGRAIYLQSCQHGILNNLRIDGSLQSTYNPIYMQACHDIQMVGCQIDSTTGAPDIYCTGSNSTCYGIAATWASALEAAPYYVDPNTNNGNEWHVLFKSGPWSRDIEALQTEIDALPTDQDIQDLQDQIDALPTDQDVADAVAAEAALREAADQGLQDQIDALPTSTNVSEAIAAARESYIMERDFNVRDFGAVGDGVTDDTQAFKDCFTYMSSVRGTSNKVMFWAVVPPGKYVITDSIAIPLNMGIRGTWPLRLHGGQEGSWLYIKDEHAPTEYIDERGRDVSSYGTITLENGSAITDIGIYYPDQVTYNNTYNQVKEYRYSIVMLQSRSNCLIERITAINPYRFIYLGWAHDKARVRRIFGYPLRVGINNVRSDDIDIYEDIHFHRGYSPTTVASSYATQNMDAFIFKGSDWNQIHNCFVYAFHNGITLLTADESSSYQGVRHLTADTLDFEVATGACVYEGDDSSNYSIYDASNGHRDIRFINCVFHGNSTSDYGSMGKGVVLGYGREYSFTNCTWRCSANTCFDMLNTGNAIISEVKFIGCNFMANGTTGAATSHYGVINNSARNLILVGCNFDTGSTSTYNDVIRVFPPAASATIVGNRFNGYAGNILRSLASNTAFTTAYMLGNIFDSCSNVTTAPSVTIGAIPVGDGTEIKYLDNTASQRFVAQTDTVTHKSGCVELFVDASGNLCYYNASGTKRTLSYT